MVDLEFIARSAKKEEALKRIIDEYVFTKRFSVDRARQYAQAVLEEVELSQKAPSDEFLRYVLSTLESGVKAGEFGVGSRGKGDYIVHTLIAKIARSANEKSAKRVILEPINHDDVGAVDVGEFKVVVGAVDGAHSRLSAFPFLMGFHDARAALRDVCVKGAIPVALMDDVHLADDGDVSKIFEFVAGVCAVCELARVPLISGSTLRVGGDMVLGDRLVGCVCAIGVLDDPSHLKSEIQAGSKIIMTEGSGGGTITTTALYSGHQDVVSETLNLDFFFAIESLRNSGALKKISHITDVTNGGVRGDLEILAKENGVKMLIDEEEVFSVINPRVRQMLDELGIDPLGVSLDSLLMFVPEKYVEEVLNALPVRAKVVGEVQQGSGCFVKRKGALETLTPKFRESAYTKLKKLVGEDAPNNFEELNKKVEEAFEKILQKKNALVSEIRKKYEVSRVD